MHRLEPAGAVVTDHPKSMARDYFETICVFVIFLLFSRAFVFQQSKIPTGSMKDTILIGDYILVNKFVYSGTPTALENAVLPVKPIERGDVVIFKYPSEPEVDYVKRVIGLPGEEMHIINGVVFIDGVPLDEPYVKHTQPPGRRTYDNYGPRVISDEHYFCMGDNRDQSADSRAWGTVHRSLMRGRALLIWYSFEEDPDAYRKTAIRDKLGGIVTKVIHFFDRTRWSRLGSLVR